MNLYNIMGWGILVSAVVTLGYWMYRQDGIRMPITVYGFTAIVMVFAAIVAYLTSYQ